jgi:hypothetical protein
MQRGDVALGLEVRHGGRTPERYSRRKIIDNASLRPDGDIVADRDVIDDPDLARQRDPISNLRAT